MLQIRPEQMVAFEDQAERRFEEEMVAHAVEVAPWCDGLAPVELREAVRDVLRRGAGFGFTLRGPQRLYLELSLVYGTGFARDPQYPWAAAALEDEAEQMERAVALFDATSDYEENVFGPAGATLERFWEDMVVRLDAVPVRMGDDLASSLLDEWEGLFPEKVGYVGHDGLSVLIRDASREARQAGIPDEGALLAALKFSFGAECRIDPFLPWIAEALTSGDAGAIRSRLKAGVAERSKRGALRKGS
jgi:hypothetical protein